jgi:hypothetical protein
MVCKFEKKCGSRFEIDVWFDEIDERFFKTGCIFLMNRIELCFFDYLHHLSNFNVFFEQTMNKKSIKYHEMNGGDNQSIRKIIFSDREKLYWKICGKKRSEAEKKMMENILKEKGLLHLLETHFEDVLFKCCLYPMLSWSKRL